MRIRDVVVTPIAFPDPPLLNAAGVHEPLALRTVLEVVLDDGTVGLGEGQGELRYQDGLRTVAPYLLGRSVFDTTELGSVVAAALSDARWSAKDRSTVTSMLEIACLDAQGKVLGVPLCDLLGGAVRREVPFAAYLFFKWAGHPRPDGTVESDEWGPALDPDGIVRQARSLVDRYGFQSLKLKGGTLPPDVEVAAIEALAAEFPHHPLRIDPNGAWSVATATDVARRLEGTLEYLEDPVLGQEAMAVIAHRTPIPLATNMCVTAFDEIPTALARGSVRIVLADHHYWGGARATTQLATVCRTFGLGLSMHSNSHLGISLQAMTHVAAAAPNLTYACDTHYPWNRDAEIVVGGPRQITGGTVAVTTTPGLGVELDRDALARAHERYLACGRTTRDDAGYQSRFDRTFDPTLPRF